MKATDWLEFPNAETRAAWDSARTFPALTVRCGCGKALVEVLRSTAGTFTVTREPGAPPERVEGVGVVKRGVRESWGVTMVETRDVDAWCPRCGHWALPDLPAHVPPPRAARRTVGAAAIGGVRLK